MKHSEAFLNVVTEAKKKIKECRPADVLKMITEAEKFVFVDVREDDEWKGGRARRAIHLGKGVIERDVETTIPDKNAKIVLYCGGGFRSALAAESLQRMGYTNVISMDGGIKAWRESGYPEDKG